MTSYYVTAKGNHRHASEHCANVRRAIRSGYPTPATADDAELPMCTFCASPDALAADTAARAAAAPARCANPGVTHPQRYQSECRACGKRGTVNRSNGRLRAHAPA